MTRLELAFNIKLIVKSQEMKKQNLWKNKFT